MKYEISSLAFTEEGLIVNYMASTDVRVDGKVFKTHSIHIHGSHADYRDGIEDLEERAKAMLRDVLEDFDESLPYEPANDDDDERGMGE